jgi:hypothetical protein
MKRIFLRSLVLGCALLFAAATVPAFTAAHGDEEREEVTTTSTDSDGTGEDETNTSGSAASARERAKHLLEAQRQKRADRQEARQAKLTQAKLRLCEAREKNINTIMNRAITRGQNQIRLFGTIAERVKTFYADKGITLENYDALIAAIDEAKTAAEADLDTLKALDFNCDSDDPRSEVEAFKAGMEEIRSSLKDYRTAVKNLIVGVKSAQGEGE